MTSLSSSDYEYKLGDQVVVICSQGPVNIGYIGIVRDSQTSSSAIGIEFDGKNGVGDFHDLSGKISTPSGYYIQRDYVRPKQKFKKGQLIICKKENLGKYNAICRPAICEFVKDEMGEAQVPGRGYFPTDIKLKVVKHTYPIRIGSIIGTESWNFEPYKNITKAKLKKKKESIIDEIMKDKDLKSNFKDQKEAEKEIESWEEDTIMDWK